MYQRLPGPHFQNLIPFLLQNIRIQIRIFSYVRIRLFFEFRKPSVQLIKTRRDLMLPKIKSDSETGSCSSQILDPGSRSACEKETQNPAGVDSCTLDLRSPLIRGVLYLAHITFVARIARGCDARRPIDLNNFPSIFQRKNH